MKRSWAFAATILGATATLGLAATAQAGGPPNGGGDGGGGAAAATPGNCSGAGLAVTSGPIEPAPLNMVSVVVTFKNTSSSQCTLVGYPDANLVDAGGQVLVHVESQPALASHLLHLNPGDSATASVQSSELAINGSGNHCGTEGTLVVTAPRDSVAHTLSAALPTCHPTISNIN